eukprot:CAMPEP_0118987542 /NCGR_PEP_ID=MMETSP1173-20130426/44358_1 /TAXON_ID=1034831 /ORGANISM="Rhizochromulina marina cf, Strain CCMP1243" /LENGTH=175 /DNA_ID=CAMNT_0006938399 /DNA_START=46 /DNA_END=573 /DNA_ORIENTATION=+
MSTEAMGAASADAPAPPPPPEAADDSNHGRRELRSVSQRFTNISYSPLRMNLVAKLLRRLTVPEALAQSTFTKKKGGAIAKDLIERCASVAEMKYGLSHDQLLVDKIFVTQGKGQKMVRTMGRGRTGIEFVRNSHLNVTLTEIDFEDRIRAASTRNQQTKWKKLEARAGSRAARP